MSHIFISYSRQDQAYVTLLAQALESHRLPLWLDDRIDYGTTWPRVIQDQLEQCTVFLLVMSSRSENSHWVQCELSMALELKKPVFPLLLEGRRWLAVAALHEVNVVGGKLPPVNFFDRLRLYFPAPATTRGFYSKRRAELEAEIVAIEPALEPATTASVRLSSEKAAEQQLTGIDQVEAELADLETTTDRTTHPKLKPPDVGRKELSECDPSKILFIKNVRDPDGDWAYSLDHIQEMGGSVENRVFELFWLPNGKGVKSASKGDLMLLNQQAKITHIVEMLNDDVRETSAGYFRWVRVVWMPQEANWSKLPHQRDIIGFSPEPPTIGGGTAYLLANLGKFQETWNSLEVFQQHVFQILTGAKSPNAEINNAEAERTQQEAVENSKRQKAATTQQPSQPIGTRQPQQPIAPPLSPARTTVSSTTLSRQQFLKWGGLSGLGLIGAFGISQALKNAPSPEVDYTRLEEMLIAKQWKDADQETLNVMLKITNREDEGWLDSESLQNFPCEALAKIDQLWVEASDGKFGFSVQKKIYVDDCGGKPADQYDETAWYCFADKVGWRVNGTWLDYSQVTFDTTAPSGHLPLSLVRRGGWEGSWEDWVDWGLTAFGFSFLVQRLVNCSR